MEKPLYKLRLEDFGGIIPYAIRNENIPNKEIGDKILIRAIPLTIYTIGLFGIPFFIWKGLEKLIK